MASLETVSASIAAALAVDPRGVLRRGHYLRVAGMLPGKGDHGPAHSLTLQDASLLLAAVLGSATQTDAVSVARRCKRLVPYLALARFSMGGASNDAPATPKDAPWPFWGKPFPVVLATIARDVGLELGGFVKHVRVAQSAPWAEIEIGASLSDGLPSPLGWAVRFCDRGAVDLASEEGLAFAPLDAGLAVVASASGRVVKELVGLFGPEELTTAGRLN